MNILFLLGLAICFAVAQNTAAMNRYAHLTEAQKQEILSKAHNVRSEREMHNLVASLANGIM